MGSTVSTGKLVAAFQAPQGPMYALFEESYEKNCHPHTPRWSCRAICNLEAAMELIFHSASYCEGGSLQGVGGKEILPESYAAAWLRELANPVQLADRDVTLEIRSSFAATVPADRWPACEARLREAGYGEVADRLAGGERVEARLHRDAELLASIYDGRTVGAWKIISSAPLHAEKASPELGYAPKKAKNSPPLSAPKMLVCRECQGLPTMFMECEGGWRSVGADYAVIARYIREDAWRDELTYPGSSRKRIKELRELTKSAPSLPSGMMVTVDRSTLRYYQLSTLDHILATAPYKQEGDIVRLTVPTDSQQLYWLMNFETAIWQASEVQSRQKGDCAAPAQASMF